MQHLENQWEAGVGEESLQVDIDHEALACMNQRVVHNPAAWAESLS